MRLIANEQEQVLEREERAEPKSTMWSWIKYIVVFAVVFLFFRFAIGITFINGNSMNPTFENNNIVLTSYIYNQLEKNDVVIINTEEEKIIKRVIALPGELVEIQKGVVFVNGEALKEDYTTGTSNDMPELKVQEGTYFVLGDNRTPGESWDSRSPDLGLIKKDAIKGKALLSLWPFKILQ